MQRATQTPSPGGLGQTPAAILTVSCNAASASGAAQRRSDLLELCLGSGGLTRKPAGSKTCRTRAILTALLPSARPKDNLNVTPAWSLCQPTGAWHFGHVGAAHRTGAPRGCCSKMRPKYCRQGEMSVCHAEKVVRRCRRLWKQRDERKAATASTRRRVEIEYVTPVRVLLHKYEPASTCYESVSRRPADVPRARASGTRTSPRAQRLPRRGDATVLAAFPAARPLARFGPLTKDAICFGVRGGAR
jgi:hypothetical protein